MNQQTYTDAEILAKFAKVVAKSLSIDASAVTPESHLDELGAESLDLLEISMEIESEFQIWMPEKTILKTAEEVFGRDVLEKDGIVTDEGKKLVLRRMPALEAELAGELTVTALNRLFLRVDSWIRLISWLKERTPTVCAACGGELEAGVAFRMKCKACAAEIMMPSGEELNRQWVREYHETEYAAAAPAPADAPEGVHSA